MKVTHLAELFGGEYVLGKEDLGTHGYCMVFGTLGPRGEQSPRVARRRL